jgi:hypothetical protein
MAVKLINVWGLTLPAAIIIFPLSYIFGDVLTEVYGYSQARKVIWLGFFCNLIAVIAFSIGKVIPPASFWEGQDAYNTILGYAPRLLVASFIAYLIGEFSNSFILTKMKILTKGRWLWTRTIGSTIVGEGLDALVFIFIAFGGTVSILVLLKIVLAHWLFKTGYEVVVTPLTYAIIGYLKGKEKVDTYDYETNFNPLAFK